MNTRKEYLSGKANVIDKTLDIQLKLDKNVADKEIIELEERVQIAESELLFAESNPNEFSLANIIEAELALEIAKDDLERAKNIRERLFPSKKEDQSINDIHNSDD